MLAVVPLKSFGCPYLAYHCLWKKLGPLTSSTQVAFVQQWGLAGPPHIGCICYAHGVYEKNMGGISASEFSNLTPITQLRSHFRMGSTNLNLSIKVSCYVPHFKASPLWQQIFFWEGVWVQCPLSTKDSSRLICGWSASSQNQYRLCRKLLFEGADAAAGGWNVSSVRVECFKSFSFCKFNRIDHIMNTTRGSASHASTSEGLLKEWWDLKERPRRVVMGMVGRRLSVGRSTSINDQRHCLLVPDRCRVSRSRNTLWDNLDTGALDLGSMNSFTLAVCWAKTILGERGATTNTRRKRHTTKRLPTWRWQMKV